MDREAFAARIDHTVLGLETTPRDVQRVCDEALEHGMNACIPPCYVEEAAAYAPELTIVTVVGFPQGQHAPRTKEREAERAWRDGADELDVVANVGRLKAGDDEAAVEELTAVVASVPVPVKVIVEAPLLTEAELARACSIAQDADADMLKTATGFSVGGATIEDVERMSNYLPVKASGGVDSYEKAQTMLEAGAERIGASAGVEILRGFPDA